MSKQHECLPPVTIGGITITENLIEALEALRDDHGDDVMHCVAETSLFISSLSNTCEDIRIINSEYYAIQYNVYRLLKELILQKGGSR
jgi:hypothetical protein